MAQPESDYSYIRAIREVQATPSLDAFLAQARTIGKKVFGLKGDPMVVPLPASLDEILEPDYQREYEGAATLNANLFAISSLRVTLFERRAIASGEVDEQIGEVFHRVTAKYLPGRRKKHASSGKKTPDLRRNPLQQDLQIVQSLQGFTPDEFTAPATKIVDSTKPHYVHKGIEYSLAISKDSPAAEVLKNQHDTIYESLRRIRVAKPLFTTPFEGNGDVLEVPFMQAPVATPERHELFMTAINEGVLRDTEVVIALKDRVSWIPKA